MNVDKILKRYNAERENLIQALHDIQDSTEGNYLRTGDLKKAADYFHISLSEINSVVEFYSMFSKKPRGKYVIRVCQSPPCYIKGAFNVLGELKNLLGIDLNDTTKDQLFTIETTSCLGACAEAPVMSVNNIIYGKLDTDKIKDIIKRYREEKQGK